MRNTRDFSGSAYPGGDVRELLQVHTFGHREPAMSCVHAARATAFARAHRRTRPTARVGFTTRPSDAVGLAHQAGVRSDVDDRPPLEHVRQSGLAYEERAPVRLTPTIADQQRSYVSSTSMPKPPMPAGSRAVGGGRGRRRLIHRRLHRGGIRDVGAVERRPTAPLSDLGRRLRGGVDVESRRQRLRPRPRKRGQWRARARSRPGVDATWTGHRTSCVPPGRFPTLA
jgi:hypothetical protein